MVPSNESHAVLVFLDCLPPPIVDVSPVLSAAFVDDDGVDRLSALPEDLICSILPRLPVKDAARTTILSRRWRSLWTSTPLILDDDHFLPARERARVVAVSRALAAHPGPIHAVDLTRFHFNSCCRELSEWARRIAAGGVKHLVLVNLSDTDDPYRLPSLPVDIFRCRELRTLHLAFWRFPDMDLLLPLPGAGPAFPHLQELVLGDIACWDAHMDYMIASSPVLKTFALVGGYYGLIRIRSPSLRSITCWSYLLHELDVAHSPLLRRLILWLPFTMEGSGKMKVRLSANSQLNVLGYIEPHHHELYIGSHYIKPGMMISPRSQIPSLIVLALLVDLSCVNDVGMIPSILRSFPNLETLHVWSDNRKCTDDNDMMKYWAEVNHIDCLASKVKKIILHCVSGRSAEFAFIQFLMRKCSVMRELNIFLHMSARDAAEEIKVKLSHLASACLATEECTVTFITPSDLRFRTACNLDIDDPFC